MAGDPRLLFGRRLRSIRKGRGWSQEELALEAGMDRTYVSGIEAGKRNVSIINICRLASALGIPPGSLFDFGKASAV